ncbi:WD40 repeat domain-containing protein [Dactylosporangium sp. NPDC005555]|uniref:WD40 repeat domain-containing protein n=1 Tax=Dactylosporangium sp. NPDC005555 TaxID=3154889 RepID=UPI0033B4F63A
MRIPAVTPSPVRALLTVPFKRSWYVVSVGRRGEAHWWEAATGPGDAPVPLPIEPGLAAGAPPLLAAAGAIAATCVDGHTVSVWDLAAGARPTGLLLPFAGPRVTHLGVTGGDAPLVLVADAEGAVHRFDARSGAVSGEPVFPHGQPAQYVSVVHAADGRILLATLAGHRVRCVDARTGARVDDPDRPWYVRAMRLAGAALPDGRTLLLAATDEGLERLDLTTGEVLPPGADPVDLYDVAVARLPDGRVLAAGAGDDGGVHRWDAATGERLGPALTGHSLPLRAITTVTSPDGGVTIISGDETGELRRWDGAGGTPIGAPWRTAAKTLAGLAVLIRADGRQILAGCCDSGLLHQWDPHTGDVLRAPLPVLARADVLQVFVDPAGRPAALILGENPDDAHGDLIAVRCDLETGVEPRDLLPQTACAVYADAGHTMLVLGEPDGSLVIRPWPAPDR